MRFAGGDFAGLPPRVASAAHLGHLLTESAPRPAPAVPERVVDGAVQWWARQIRRHLTDPLATVPALAELREGEAEGAELAGERVWEAFDWLVDRLPFVHRREAKRVTIAADANELEQGIAAAAVEIRKKGLPPGQP